MLMTTPRIFRIRAAKTPTTSIPGPPWRGLELAQGLSVLMLSLACRAVRTTPVGAPYGLALVLLALPVVLFPLISQDSLRVTRKVALTCTSCSCCSSPCTGWQGLHVGLSVGGVFTRSNMRLQGFLTSPMCVTLGLFVLVFLTTSLCQPFATRDQPKRAADKWDIMSFFACLLQLSLLRGSLSSEAFTFCAVRSGALLCLTRHC